MGPITPTKQVIQKYYDLYRDNEVVFTKDIIRSLKLDVRQTYIKCEGNQWPCLINSTSFQMAKIIIGMSGGAFQQISRKDCPSINLRYCFIGEGGEPVYFFVTCHVTEIQRYAESKDLAVITLSFNQQPPDDLIIKLGALLDADFGFTHRHDERVLVNDASQRLLGIGKKETIIFVQNVPRRCILWDISFSGASVLIMGLAAFLKGKECSLRFIFSDPDEVLDVPGVIMRAEPLQNRRDICSTGIKYNDGSIPIAYKIRINNFLTSNKKTILSVASNVQNAAQNATNDKKFVIKPPTESEADKKINSRVASIQALPTKQ